MPSLSYYSISTNTPSIYYNNNSHKQITVRIRVLGTDCALYNVFVTLFEIHPYINSKSLLQWISHIEYYEHYPGLPFIYEC